MTPLKLRLAACLLAMSIWATACNDRGNTTDSGGDMNDTNRVDSRRGATDTTNYLTKDTGNKSQEVIDPNPPQNSRN
jgi:hypothetical protein